MMNVPRDSKFTSVLLLVLGLAISTGCSDGGPELAAVTGKLTVGGVPVPNATLTFIPESGSPSYGITDQSGKYELMFTDTKKGAMIGNHIVVLEVAKLSKGEIAEMKAQGMEVSTASVEIPKEYKKRGSLTAEVQRGRNDLDFDLPVSGK